MPKKRYDPKPKTQEEWTIEDWKRAYEAIVLKYSSLETNMRKALVHMNRAQTQLAAAI